MSHFTTLSSQDTCGCNYNQVVLFKGIVLKLYVFALPLGSCQSNHTFPHEFILQIYFTLSA